MKFNLQSEHIYDIIYYKGDYIFINVYIGNRIPRKEDIMVIIWIVVFVAALLVEAATFALVSIWFAAGALGALIAAALGANLTVQLVVFALLAGLLLAFTRPILKKLFPHRFIPTNSELEVGRTAVVTEEINNETGSGRVKLGGVNWAAFSSDSENIPEGETVTVTAVCSAKLAVSKNPKDDK